MMMGLQSPNKHDGQHSPGILGYTVYVLEET